jgi:hypothetical protein
MCWEYFMATKYLNRKRCDDLTSACFAGLEHPRTPICLFASDLRILLEQVVTVVEAWIPFTYRFSGPRRS